MHMHNIEKEVMRVSYLDGDMEGFGKKGKETNTIIIFDLETLNIFLKHMAHCGRVARERFPPLFPTLLLLHWMGEMALRL